MEDNEMDWAKAEAHLYETVIEYVAMLVKPGANVGFALRWEIAPLCKRFSDGERSPELYAEIMGISL